MSTPVPVRVSVVVPTFLRPDLLARCLQALQRQTLAPHRYEIVVCDDGPSEAARSVVRQAALGAPEGLCIRYLPIPNTQGPAAARNQGWQQARAPIIAFTDDDTVPDPAWLSEGLAAMAGGADAAAGRIVMPLPDRPSDIELDAAGLARAEFVTANCFVRRDVLEDIGGFDERFGMAWREDSDLHFTLLEAGRSIVPASRAVVVHPLRKTRFAAGIGMQKKVLFDVLLYCKHPCLYRERIRQSPPWFYLCVVVLLILAPAMAVAGYAELALWVAIGWATATLAFFARRLKKSARSVRNIAELLVTSVLIPPLSIFWRLVGAYRFGVRFP